MKRKLIISILLVITATFYFILDRYLYYYGKSDFSFYNLLPMNIRPDNRPTFEKGFVMWDEYEMSLIGNGVSNRQVDSITIDKIINYGFNEDLVIAKITDTDGNNRIFEYTKNKNPNYKPEISVRLIQDTSELSTLNLKWIEINNNENIRKIALARSWLMLLFTGLIIALTYLLFRQKKQLPTICG